MAENYWTNYRARRIARRRVLSGAAAGSVAITAAGLVGCGDDDDDDSGAPTSGATGEPTSSGASPSATSAVEEPKRGGVWRTAAIQDIASLDPYAAAASNVKSYGAHVYSRLFTVESAQPDAAGIPPITIVGDAAESIEGSADGLTYTVKLKGNVKFHPPVNRMMDAEDVVFSWRRFTGRLEGGAPSPNSDRLNVIGDVQAVDDLTVVFHLEQPFGPFQDLIADATTLLLMPKETGEAFDPAQMMVGSGPWMFKEHVPGSSLAFSRNPDWHFGPDRPYMDEVQLSVVGDQATILNQFNAGNLDTVGVDGLQVTEVARAIPDVQIIPSHTSGLVGYYAFSSVADPSNAAPWTDIRVRHAMSMALDRDALVEAAYNRSFFIDAGFDFAVPVQGYLPASFGQYVVHPVEESDLAQWFTYDPEAAQALLDEAGGGFDINFLDANIYGAAHDTVSELTMAFWSDIGINSKLEIQDYRSVWIPDTYQAGNFSGDRGVAHVGQAGINEPGTFLRSAFHPDATLNQGHIDDPVINEAFVTYFAEPDIEQRVETLRDLQMYLLEQLYYIPTQWGSFPGVTAVQPNVRGPGQYVSFGYGAAGQDNTYYWKA